MTHVQKVWTADEALARCADLRLDDVRTIRAWLASQPNLPQYLTDEQIILFLHSCYSDIENTKRCIEEYYRLRLKVPNFFENRDVQLKELDTAMKEVLHYSIFPKPTPKGYRVVFHRLNDTDPSKYNFNDGFKLLCMMIDSVYVQHGPLPGLILLFDLRGVKIGHLTKVPLLGVKRGLEYLQDAIPVRLKGIHILNTHPIIDKIMLLIRPFVRKSFLSLLHFHKADDEEVYETIPRDAMAADFGGELDDIAMMHEKFIKEMHHLRDVFVQEEKLMFPDKGTNKKKVEEVPLSLSRLEID